MYVEHLKQRSCVLAVNCILAAFSWLNEEHQALYTANYAIFIVYLCWDTVCMIQYPALFRKDLLVHHLAAFIACLCTYQNARLVSRCLVSECLSVFNYPLRQHQRMLTTYRVCIIFTVRLPVTVWVFCEIPTVAPLCLFFLLYDMWILYSIHMSYNKRRVR